MKRTIFLVLVALMVTGFIWAQTTIDIALNGDFENWTEGVPDYWYGNSSSIGTTNVNEYTVSSFSGTKACQLVRTSSTHARFSTQTLSIIADTQYTVKYYARGKGEIRNAFYRLSTNYYSPYSNYTILDTDEWTEISWPFQFSTTVSNDIEVIFSVRNTDSVRDHIQIDAVTITYIEPEGAVLYVNPDSISGLDYVVGEGPSTLQSFELTGTNLDGTDVTITPPANFSVSLTSLPAYDGSSTMIDVQLDAGLAVGIYSGDITISGGGASSVTVALSGNVTEPPSPGYFVDFEGVGETKTAYASGTVNLSGLDWNMTEVLIGTSADDWKEGARSARLRGYGTSVMTMLEDKTTGAGIVSFSYRRYGTALQVDWKVEYSTNDGNTWNQIGNVFTALDSDVVQHFSEIVNIPGNVRIRIKRATETGTVNRQLNIDNILITDYDGPPPPEKVATPTFDPPAGTYYATQYVIISTTTEGASIYYSFDNDPYDWQLYSEQLAIDETTTIWAYATKDGMEDSDVASATYVITLPTVETPTFSPPAGTYYETQYITISTTTEDADVYYSYYNDPFVWQLYSAQLEVAETTTIWAKASKEGYFDSEIVLATYVIINTPLFCYWNFNSPPTSGNWPQPIPAYTGSGEIIYTFTDAVSFTGTIINGIDEEVNGGSFVPRPATDLVNNGEHFDIIVSTSGYEDILISYATQRTDTGFTSQAIYYSLNGVDFIYLNTITDIPTSWAVRIVDFSSIPEVNDNPNFIIRIVLDGGTGATGNNRFDNIRVMGFEIDEEPLPVELSSFMATYVAVNQYVELQWVSETETNMLGFNVYRNTIHTLDEAIKVNTVIVPATNTSNQQRYNFVDESISPDMTYYYWLELVQLDLTNGFHGPTSVLTSPEDPGLPPGVEYVTRLIGAYPNPFNPGTNIMFELSETANVSIVIYNMRGQLVKTLVSQNEYQKGQHSLFWDGTDNRGNASMSGVYFYHFRTSTDYDEYKKMMLMK